MTGAGTIDEGTCQQLLARVDVGRIAFTDRALPQIEPVRFVWDHGRIVVTTGLGSRVARGCRHAVVAFETGGYDASRERAWSVTTIGRSLLLTDPAETAQLETLGMTPLQVTSGRCYIGITVGTLRGNWLQPPRQDRPPVRRPNGGATGSGRR